MSDQQVTDYEQRQLGMLLWQPDVHERNGRKHEAFEIRAWVTDFLSGQSKDDSAGRTAAMKQTTYPTDMRTSVKPNPDTPL